MSVTIAILHSSLLSISSYSKLRCRLIRGVSVRFLYTSCYYQLTLMPSIIAIPSLLITVDDHISDLEMN